jgi:hypothetical protein
LSQNGQRGSLLVCDWLYSVGQNHFYVMMLFIQGCWYIQSLHFVYVLQEDYVQNSRQWNSSPLHPFGRRGILSGHSSVKHHPSGRRELSVRTPFCVKKLQTVTSCIRPDVSATRSDALQCSTSKRISFPNKDMGRQLQPSRRRGYSVRTLSLIRQVVQKTFNHPDVSLHCSDTQTLLWKLRAAEVQPSGR